MGRKIERKVFPFAVTALDAEGRTVEGYAAVFGNVDLGYDVIHPGAFAKTLAERGSKIALLWQHDSTEPLGPPPALAEDERGLFMRAVISDTARGRDALALLRDGAPLGLSIGYEPVKAGVDFEQRTDGTAIRHLREVKLWEVSLVTFPMNEEARVTALKTVTDYDADIPLAGRDRPWDADAAIGRMREWAGVDGDNPDWRAYARGFFWHDKEQPELLGSYKLPYCDIIDGELTAVPRGIFAAAGGRGVDRADIPEADKARIREAISRWYRRMREEFDDDSLVSPFERDAAEVVVEEKEGRVLARRNVERIVNAMRALREALEDAGLDFDEIAGEAEKAAEPDAAPLTAKAAEPDGAQLTENRRREIIERINEMLSEV